MFDVVYPNPEVKIESLPNFDLYYSFISSFTPN